MNGKTAVITGASRGIGKAIAIELASKGANVVIGYLNNEEEAYRTFDLIKDSGGRHSCVKVDVTNKDDVKFLVAHAEDCSILINNAGITNDKSFRKMDESAWHNVLEVNLTGAYNTISAFLPLMLELGYGRIVNISSVIGQTGGFGQTNYAASKAALIGFTKSLALEVAKNNVMVNCVCPGFIATEMVQAIPEPILNKIIDKIPVKRLGKVEEVAQLVRFLVTEGDYITGQQFNVNGGLYM